MGMGCPPVEDLARWLADEEWLPEPHGGAARTELTDDERLSQSVWAEMPMGLRAWCLRFEPTMWKGGELLPKLESLIGRCAMPSGVADLHMAGVACTCGVTGAAERDGPMGHGHGMRHGRRGEKRPLRDEGRSDCSTAADAAQCGSEEAERAGTSAQHALGGGMHEGRSSWAGLPMATYWGHRCMAWRRLVVERMVAYGMDRDMCGWVLDDRLGFEPAFGKRSYAWDAERPKLRWMLSIVDKVVSLMMGRDRPACLVWDPITRVTEPEDWRPGGVHEGPAVRVWEGLHEVSAWVLEWVRHGFFVAPSSEVPSTTSKNAAFLDPHSREFDKAMFDFAEGKLKKDEKLGVIRRMGPSARPDNVNRISLAPKNSETEPWRLVGDCRKPNKHYGKKKVRFETLRHVREVFEPHDWLWLADLKSAYHSIYVQERLARQLGFRWRDIYYKWISLPFGFVHSPYCFQRLMRQVVKHCRWARQKILQFLDDGMGGHASFVEAVRQRNDVYNLMCNLGFRLSTKSDPLPEQTKRFLGMIVHTAGPVCTFHVPLDKIEKLKVLMESALTEVDAWTMRKIAKITGKLLSMSLAIPMTRLMSRSLYACMHSNSRLDWDGLIASSAEAVRELRWMVGAMAPFNTIGFPIWVSDGVADFDITADASPTAGGFVVTDAMEDRIRMLATVWFRPEETDMAQCHRELWIVCLLVRGLAFQLAGKRIRIRVDAMTTVSYWKNGGGKSALLTSMTKLLWATCLANRITIVDIVHIAGTTMVEEGVDDLSRPKLASFGSERDREGWSLTTECLQLLQRWVGGPFSIDRFASRVNAKCARYTAARWEPEAVAPASAFADAHDWRQQPDGSWEWNLCFPPHWLVAGCLARAERDRAWMCLIVPNWPSMTWWPKLCRYEVRRRSLGTVGSLQRLEGGRWVPIRRAPFDLVAVVVDCRGRDRLDC